MTILYRALVGSHLYGTAHQGSDFDWYEIHTELPRNRGTAKQEITRLEDTIRVTLGEFMRQADKGVPQALEVMFSPIGWPEDDKIAALRSGYRINLAQVQNTYERTIKAFRKVKPTTKRLAHARRLAYNKGELLTQGRFDPTDRGWLD